MQFQNKKQNARGFSTLELLIAFAVLTISMTAVIVMVFGNQTLALDAQFDNHATYKARSDMAEAFGLAQGSFSSLVSNSSTDADDYLHTRTINDLSPCAKHVTTQVGWTAEYNRLQQVLFSSLFVSTSIAAMLGGDCTTGPPDKKWDNPEVFASDTLNPGKSTTIDVLQQVAYLGQDKEPFLAIADTKNATLGQQNLFITFDNGFNSDGKTINALNDIDVYKDSATGNVYALIAMASSTAQLAILDVTDIKNPVLISKRQLAGVSGSQPNGYRVHYYDGKAYIVTRETAGPEFHLFDISNPANPIELGSGTELVGPTPPNGTTVNDLVVWNNVAYFAAEKDAAELLVYDVSNPATPVFMPSATVDLAGNWDGMSIFLIGNKVYLGRQSVTSGPELYVFNNENPHAAVGGLPILGSAEIGTTVLGIQVAGKFGFLATEKTNEEFQVWDILNPAGMVLIKKYNFGNIIAGGLDYEPDFIYSTGSATPNFQILYSQT